MRGSPLLTFFTTSTKFTRQRLSLHHNRSPHVAIHHRFSPHRTSHPLKPRHTHQTAQHHFTIRHVTSHTITRPQLTTQHTSSVRITSQHLTPHDFSLRHATSHHPTSPHITTHHSTSLWVLLCSDTDKNFCVFWILSNRGVWQLGHCWMLSSQNEPTQCDSRHLLDGVHAPRTLGPPPTQPTTRLSSAQC